MEALIYLKLGEGMLGQAMTEAQNDATESIKKIIEAMDYSEHIIETQMMIAELLGGGDDDDGSADDQ
ncbi:MAG: hypothetical protein LUD72_09085 [Bacteroidales bacterium]|nr:hypothetical protein [Bacteroidales bacterium]